MTWFGLIFQQYPEVNPLSSIVIGKGLTSYIMVLSDILYQIQHRNKKLKIMVVHLNRLKPCIQWPPNLLLNQTDNLHVAGPGEEQRVVEDNGDIDGDISA